MRLLTIISLIIYFTILSHAQISVTGKLLDADTENPIDFANISVSRSGETAPFTGTVTDADGNFTVSLSKGTYIIKCSFIGYHEKSKTIKVDSKPIQMGKIYLESDNQQLQEVEVVAQGSSMRFELDKKVFSVDQNIASAGGVATDILQNIPSVDVDGEGNISLRNNESVEVWINGKPSGFTADNRGQILEQLPAESIKEIEVITNPSAKYDPEGTAGIINIVMKKNRKAGYYGSVSAGTNYPWGGIPGYNASANINFSQGIVDSYLNIGYRNNNSIGGTLSDRYDYLPTDTINLYQIGKNNRNYNGLFVRAGIDFRITDNSSIGLSGFGMFGKNTTNNTKNYEEKNITTDTHIRTYDRLEEGSGKFPGGNVTLDYRIDFTPKQNLWASVNYSQHNSSNSSTYTQNDVTNGTQMSSKQQQNKTNNNSRWTIKADYTNNFTENSRLEAGWQTSLRYQLSTADAMDLLTQQPLEEFYNDFDYREQVHALYVTYGNRFWEKLSAQVGLRGEYMLRHTTTNGVENKPQSYFQLFPSAYLSYSLPKGNELQVNYTRRVDRPRGRQINPFKDLSDSTNISYGNEELLPQFSSALELNYLKNWQSHTLSAGLFYRYSDGVIQNIRYVTNGQMENTYVNVSRSQNAGIELVSKNKLWGEFLQLTTSVNAYFSQMDSATYSFEKATVYIPQQNNFTWSARMNASFLFLKNLTGQITGRYSSPRLLAQGRTAHSYALDLGLRATFFDRQLSVNLMARDILDSRGRKSENWSDNFYEYSEFQWHGRTIGLTVTYNFGNMKPKKKNKPVDTMDESMEMDE